MTGDKPGVLLGHSYWGRGGAEIAAMWLVQSLLERFEVDILTRGGWDVEALNSVAGTSVRKTDVRVLKATNLPGGLAAIAHGLYLRHARRASEPYGLRVTASGVIDWGRPAIHCLSSVTWNDELKRRFETADTHSRPRLRHKMVWAASDMVAGYPACTGGAGDLFVANSEWTAAQSAPYCPGEIKVIYPPVFVPEAMPSRWNGREDAVVCLGRISPEKEIESCIRIVEQIRQAGHPLRLYIVGEVGADRYAQQIAKMCRLRKDWVELTGALYGADKWRLLRRCRYGISACRVEAFGIATAEMAASGMVVFIPSGCAQAEIIKSRSQQYTSLEDGARKMLEVLRSGALQEELSSQAISSGGRFTPDRYAERITEVFCAFVRDAGGPTSRQAANG